MSTSEHYVERAGGGRVEGSAPQVPAPHPTHRAARGFFRLGSRLFNPLTVRLAGSRAVPMLAVIHHRGRRSARPYATPVGARRTADGFVVPLTFGERSDWFRNVRAAGGCVVRWNGASYPVADPELVGWEVARPACYPVERVVMPWLGIGQFVRLRDDPTGERAAARKGGQEATGRARERRTAPQQGGSSTMRYLVSIDFNPGQDAGRAALLPAEQATVRRLMEEGVVEAGYLSADRSRSWMVLRADSRERAHEIMASLPFYPFMDLDYIPLFDVQPGPPRRDIRGDLS